MRSQLRTAHGAVPRQQFRLREGNPAAGPELPCMATAHALCQDCHVASRLPGASSVHVGKTQPFQSEEWATECFSTVESRQSAPQDEDSLILCITLPLQRERHRGVRDGIPYSPWIHIEIFFLGSDINLLVIT